MRKLRKQILSLALAILVALCAAPFAAAAEPYTGWKQYDPRWASVVLTGKTMKQVGCLATAVAMLAVRAGLRDETDFDPGVFAAEMKKAGGFNDDDDLIWEAIPKAVPGLAAESAWEALTGTQAEKAARLKGWLDRGYQVAVAVKGGGHWVALRSVTGGMAVMMDPGSAATDLFGKYPAAGVTRAALLRADAPKIPAPVKQAQPKGAFTMAESIRAFLKDMGALFLEILKFFYVVGK